MGGSDLTALNALFDAVRFSSTLTTLDISRNVLGSSAVPSLASMVSKNASLTSLDVAYTKLSVDDILKVYVASQDHKSLISLCFTPDLVDQIHADHSSR